MKNNNSKLKAKYLLLAGALLCTASSLSLANVTLESEVKITDEALHFDGEDLDFGNVDNPSTGSKYDFFFGPNISAHGDAVKTYKHYVFVTWYKGGKDQRNVMLSRYNTRTGSVATIEFPHRHTGFRGNPLVGESHNTIGLAVSPINGTIHMVYDMHAYTNSNHGEKFKNDYFRYSYSQPGTAEVSDSDFKLNKFIKDTSNIRQGNNDYKHLTMTGNLADRNNFSALTYPKFFSTDDGTLLLYMRLGGNNNGAYVFNRYDAANNKWTTFQKFNHNNQTTRGNDYNWGLYGNMKYVNGKLRVGFQQRSSDNSDPYLYQNGLFYAYSDHPQGNGQWHNHRGEDMTFPLVNSDEIKVYEPGNFISHGEPNSIYMVGGFDWTVTARGDIHMFSSVRSTDRNRSDFEEERIHSYKPVGSNDFIHSTDFVGSSAIYTAGDDIYAIGLEDGKPFVERALGGTNNFERLYTQSGGKTFNHGVVYIVDGKVYYYLMERATGSARPLYVQVIDLDLDSDLPPEVSFPVPRRVLTEGYPNLSFNIAASSPNSGVGIKNVKLFIDDVLVRQENVAPYEWGKGQNPTELVGLAPGTYTFKAVATDDNNLQSEATIPVTVNPAQTNDCSSTVNVPWNTRTEVSLSGNNSCIRFDRNLNGNTVQFWDSDTNNCDFRGTVSSVDGNGTLGINSNYKQSGDFTGTTLKLAPSNSCRFIKVRGF